MNLQDIIWAYLIRTQVLRQDEECLREKKKDLQGKEQQEWYYREAVKLLTARKNQAGLEKLQSIVRRSKIKFSDYEKARAEIVELILQNK